MTKQDSSDFIKIQPAGPEDAESLTQVAIRSKAHWGYSPEFMRAATAELTVLTEDILNNEIHYFVATRAGKTNGFYALEKQSGDAIELGAMFVEPEVIGLGVGKALIRHAKKMALKLGAKKLEIQSDPCAKGFYQAVGGKVTGERESESIPGRFLPTLEITLGAGDID